VARENQLSKFGTVSLDGAKIHANASRHRALSPGYLEKIEAQLKAEVQEMLSLAEEADQSSVPDGVSLPDEIKRREDRLAAIAAAKAKIEERAKERYLREQAEYARVRQFCHKGVGFSRPAIGFMLVSGFFAPLLWGHAK